MKLSSSINITIQILYDNSKQSKKAIAYYCTRTDKIGENGKFKYIQDIGIVTILSYRLE